MLRLAKVGKRDVLYDLGSGRGLVVRLAAAEFSTKKAIGVEVEKDAHERARRIALRQLSKGKLRKVDFWYRNFDDRDIDHSDATVVYNSLEENEWEISFYKKAFRRKRLRVIKKDLPFVSYEPTAISSENRSCWFFAMRFPLTKIRSPEKWASIVLGKPNAEMKDVYRYYLRQVRRRNIKRSEDSIKHLRRLVAIRF